MEKTYKESINMWALDADAGHILHRVGSDDYTEMRHCMTGSPSEWEEVALTDIPLYTKAQYDAKVAELVHERYTADEESALHRKMINAIMSPATVSEEGAADKALEEYEAYNAYVQGCKARAKELLGNATEQEN